MLLPIFFADFLVGWVWLLLLVSYVPTIGVKFDGFNTTNSIIWFPVSAHRLPKITLLTLIATL